MSQQEVLTYLTNHKDRWVTNHEIRDILNISQSSANVNLRKLSDQGFITHRNISEFGRKHYEYKVRIYHDKH